MGKNLALFCAEVILALSWYLFLVFQCTLSFTGIVTWVNFKTAIKSQWSQTWQSRSFDWRRRFRSNVPIFHDYDKKKPSLTSATWSILKHNCCSFYFRLHSGESATPEEIKEFCKGQVSQWTVIHSESIARAFFDLIS